MKSIIHMALIILAGIAVAVIILYVILIGGSHVYISGNEHFIMDHPAWKFIYKNISSFGIPGLTTYGPILVDELNVLHGFRNVIYLFCSAASMMLMPFIMLIFWFASLFIGGGSESFSSVGGLDILKFIGFVVLILLLTALWTIITWVALLFQGGSLAYTVVVLILGIIALAAGFPSGAAPYAVVIIFIMK